MNYEIAETDLDPVAPDVDAANCGIAMEKAEENKEDDCGPAFFEEDAECVALLSSVRASLWQLQGRDVLPTAAEDQHGVSAALQRFDCIVERYQDCPHLLHSHLETLLGPLVEMLQHFLPAATDVWSVAEGADGNESGVALREEATCYVLGATYNEYDVDAPKTVIHRVSRSIYVVVKTAGEKCCTSYFSNDVKFCEDVFYALCLWQRNVEYRPEWEVRYCLLLWLSNLVLVPFSLSIIDTADRGSLLSDAVMNTAKVFLSDTSRCREGAALLVARLLTRPDGESHRERFFAYAQEVTTDSSSSSLVLHGVLLAVAKTLKCGKRSELLPYAPRLIPCVAAVSVSRSSDALVCKAAVKVIQQLALTLLRGRSASWRYQRHITCLDKNLSAFASSTNAAVEFDDNTFFLQEASLSPCNKIIKNDTERNEHDNYFNDNNNNNNNEDDECVIENDEGLEEAIGVLLMAICHKDTVVRWCAAKGIGRICDRLPRAMTEDVISAVMDVFTNEHLDSNWHGGLLAVAELCRRSILQPQLLVSAVQRITQGLSFDLIKGTYSVGSHVRDAACYACWSIARAYDASDIKEHVYKLSTSLVVTSVFDREVNVRRAAAAAFQESVGRLGNFPDGIRLVTTMDFFSLASLKNAYLHVAPLVAQNQSYRERMLEELVANKLLHWDRRVRCHAAQALGILSTLEAHMAIYEVVPELLSRATDTSVAARHGAILGLAEMVGALDASLWSEELVCRIVALIPRLDAARLFRSRGGEYVRQACCRLLAAIARRRWQLPVTIEVQKVTGCMAHVKTLGKLQDFFEDTWKQILEWLQFDAVDAYETFAATYYTEFAAPFHQKVLENMINGSSEETNPMERRGNLLAMGALPWCVISEVSPSTALTAEAGETTYFIRLLHATMGGTKLGKRKDMQDAESRRNAVRSMRKILLCIPPGTPQLTPELYELVVQHILDALDDYATDRRGDVGSFVRTEAISAIPPVVRFGMQNGCGDRRLALRAAQALIKQSMEKLDRLRGLAVAGLLELVYIQGLLSEDKSAADSEFAVLRDILDEGEAESAEWSLPQVSFAKLARPLLRTKVFAPCVVEGLAVSAGSLSVHIMQPALDAFLSIFRASPQDSARLSRMLITVAAKYTHNERVVVPLCVTINQLMNAGVYDESFHLDVVEILRNELKHYSTTIHVILPLVAVLGDLCRSNVLKAREAAWRLSLKMIASRYPKVRAKMGTDMYTALLFLTSAEAPEGWSRAMAHITATQWDSSDAAKVRLARDELYEMLGISSSSEVTEINDGEKKKSTKHVVTDSYLHLVREAGY